MNVESIVHQGLELHQSGQTERAKILYLAALKENPIDPDANNLIANIYRVEGNLAQALYHSNIAIDNRRHSAFFNTRGMIFNSIGRYNDAVSDLSTSIKLDPQNAEALNNLSIAYKEVGDARRALEYARKAIEIREEFPEAYVSLGIAHQDRGDIEDALQCFEKSLQLKPDFFPAIANKAKLLYRCERFLEAIPLFNKAMLKGFCSCDIVLPYAHILINSGETEQAVNIVTKLLSEKSSLASSGALFEDDIMFSVVYHVCNYLSDVVNKKDLAINLYKKIQPYAAKKDALIDINISKIQFEKNDVDGAIASIQKSLISPAVDDVSRITSLNNLGVFYMSKRESHAAIQCFESVYALDSSNVVALGWLLKEKSSICDWNNYARYRQELDSLRLKGNTTAISGFTPLAIYDDPVALLYWARLAARDMFGEFPLKLSETSARKGGKIKLGFYSYDFRNHPVAHLTVRLFELLDRSRFEVYAYSYGPDDQSAVRKRVIGAVDFFIDLRESSNIEIADRIKSDSIDILIDLTGNTLQTRSQVLKYKPAGIQMHWLGFIGTMGTSFYDYIIVDDYLVRNGEESFYSEKLINMDNGFHIMDDTRLLLDDRTTKADHGLPEDAFVFGNFCQTFKIQPETFDLWLDILESTKSTVLWLATGPNGAIDNLKAYAEKRGVDPSRIYVAERCELQTYMSRLSKIDLFLDTFPYTSGTLASDALLAGCPLLTMTGRTMVSRMAGSIQVHHGLQCLVASSPEEYVSKAVHLAGNKKAFAELKAKVYQLRNTLDAFGSEKFTKNFEKIMRSLLQSH